MTRLDVYPITLEDCAKQWRADQDGYIVMKSRAEAAEERIITLRAERNAADTLLSEAEARAAQAEAQLTAAVLPVAELVARANEAEAKAAQAEAEVAAHREQQAAIRELVNAYSEHDTVEAVRRWAMTLQEERNTAWTELRVIRETIGADENEATSDEVARIVAGLRRQLVEAQAEAWHERI